MITVSETDLQNILADVEKELGLALKSEVAPTEGQPLAKALPTDDDKESPSAEASDSAPPAGPTDTSPEAPPAASPAAPTAGPTDSAPAPDASAAPESDASGDFNSLVSEYSKLAPEELKAHYMAVKTALFQSMGSSPSASAPPDASASMGAPPPAAPPVTKTEVPANPANGGMEKSEKDSDAKYKALEDKFGLLLKATELLAAPQRKAITSISQVQYLGKGEPEAKKDIPQTREGVMAKLNERARDPKLSKSDRSLITAFAVHKADVSEIEHLLK